jgi:glycosyltransferase involved in cell wall biosynthesis
MRVGVNGRAFAVDEPGGAVQAAVRLTRELARRDADVVVFGHDSLDAQFPDLPVVSRGYLHDSQPFGVVWERAVLPRLARAHDVDVLFCPNGNGPLVDPSVPVVVQIHDVNALEGYSSRLHRTYRRLTVPRSARVADAVVTVSEFSKRELVSWIGVSPDDVYVAYNGVDETFREPGEGTPFDCPESFVLYVGAMNPRKNVGRLVRAFRRLEAEKLLLVGPENDLIFDDLSIRPGEDVVTPGYLTRGELKYAYTHADAFVYPSLYEGFGLPPLEAMACGTPVVAGNAAALPEVLGDAAAFVDPYDVEDIADGMRRVLNDAEFAEELVERGHERAKRYTWERAGETVLETLRGCVG